MKWILNYNILYLGKKKFFVKWPNLVARQDTKLKRGDTQRKWISQLK